MKFTLKQARKYADFTQKEMAERLGIALDTYRGYEHGDVEMRVTMLRNFCKIVGIKQEDIIFLQNS